MKKSIPLKDLNLIGHTQQRPVDDEVVKRYSFLMADGVVFPPVEVISDGKINYLVDGFHRYFAVKKLNKTHIEANVETGTQREAIWLSFSANKDSGFPRQPGTGKEIILKILADKEWAKISPKEIAKWVGVTERYVFQIQAETTKSYPMNSSEDRPANQAKNKVFRSKTRKVNRGGQEYEMKKPESKIVDSTGKKVPEHLVDVFSRSTVFRDMIKQLNDMLRTVKDGIEKKDPLYSLIKIENLEAQMRNVKSILRFAKPYAVCPYCGGDVNNKDCRCCNGQGFVNERVYQTTPEELKK